MINKYPRQYSKAIFLLITTAFCFFTPIPALSMAKRVALPQPLLFQFVSASSTYNTKIIIANTSKDPLGTVETAGTCTISFHGTNPRENYKTPSIAAGTSFSFSLSSLAPNFQGYLIADCDFSQARGEAIYADTSVSTVATHIQAEVISLPRDSVARPLLFSYISNLTGLDGRITISNTSSDGFGTAPQNGSCSVHFYGTSAPLAYTTPTINAGDSHSFLISTIAPGFDGYVIADCNFPLARGFAFLTTGGGKDAFEEEAEIISSPRSTTQKPLLFSFVSSAAGFNTGFAISNTTEDPFGTTQASGKCTLHFYGSLAPANITTPVIPAGTTYANNLSSIGVSGFSGYMIADCAFPMARGMGLLNSGGTLYASQPGEVITSPRLSANRPLLLPYITNVGGFNTGIAIANTSMDTSGSTTHSGTCTFYFYGSSAPAANYTTPSIAAGQTYQNVASTFAPGFQGYSIASCGFPLARIYTFVSDSAGIAVAYAIDGEVIDPVDSDGDLIPDLDDGCPTDNSKRSPGVCGCGVADTDSDGDGVADCVDACPSDSTKSSAGACGCGQPETDSDGDGTPDCIDLCPSDPSKIAPNTCGCGVADTDSDKDGTSDCSDLCPLDISKTAPGVCGCGVSDSDANSNGAADCLDPKSTTIPTKAIVTVKRSKGMSRLTFQLQQFLGRVTYSIILKGPNNSHKQIKLSKKASSSTLSLKLSPGTYKVTYTVKVGSIVSKTSAVTKIKIK